MSDYAQLKAQTSHPQLEESDIFLVLKNPLSDVLSIDWKISFPFPVIPDNKTGGTTRLNPYDNQEVSWTTALAKLSDPKRQTASEQEIVVKLRLSAAGNAFQDGTRDTLKQLSGR